MEFSCVCMGAWSSDEHGAAPEDFEDSSAHTHGKWMAQWQLPSSDEDEGLGVQETAEFGRRRQPPPEAAAGGFDKAETIGAQQVLMACHFRGPFPHEAGLTVQHRLVVEIRKHDEARTIRRSRAGDCLIPRRGCVV